MTATQNPNPVAADSTGLPDSNWIGRVRDMVRDYPEYAGVESWTADGTNGVVSATASPVRTSKRPVKDGSLSVSDTTGSINYTVVTTGTPTGTQVLINYDTGEMTFAAAPTVNHVLNWNYQYCKWSDQTIDDQLMAGLRKMFPRVGKTITDTSISIQTNVWDYTLPTWCQDPRSRIHAVYVVDPNIPTEPYRDIRGGWFRKDLTTLHIPHAQSYSPVARLQIVGWGPYLTLADLEPQLYDLPCLYAAGMLLVNQDTFRLRQDTMVPLTQEGGQQPLMLTNAGSRFLKQFEDALNALARTPGPGYNVKLRPTYNNLPA